MELKEKRIILGLKLKNCRKRAKLTQEQLSSIIDIDISGLSKVENGKCFPSMETVCKIIEALKIDPSELFDFLGAKETSKTLIVNEKIKALSEKEIEKVYSFIELLKK